MVVPLGLLPFDLNGRIKRAIDKLNNDLLISEMNRSLTSGFGGSGFAVEGVTTSDNSMTVRLRQQ